MSKAIEEQIVKGYRGILERNFLKLPESPTCFKLPIFLKLPTEMYYNETLKNCQRLLKVYFTFENCQRALENYFGYTKNQNFQKICQKLLQAS